MVDTVGGDRSQRRRSLRDLVSKAIAEHLVGDAPDDYDEVMRAVPVASGRVRILVFLAALAFSWALIILVAVALCCGVSQPKPRRAAPGTSYVRCDRPAFTASSWPPAGADLRPTAG